MVKLMCRSSDSANMTCSLLLEVETTFKVEVSLALLLILFSSFWSGGGWLCPSTFTSQQPKLESLDPSNWFFCTIYKMRA